jgi:hypothetical protein
MNNACTGPDRKEMTYRENIASTAGMTSGKFRNRMQISGAVKLLKFLQESLP